MASAARAVGIVIPIALVLALLLTNDAACARVTPMVKLAGNHPTDVPGKPTGRIDPDRTLTMAVTLRLRDQKGLQQLLAEQQNPSSPDYRRWLTPQEFSSRFGPDPAQFNAIREWLTAQGFEIESSSLERRTIVFKGTAAQAERVFKTQIVAYPNGAYANTIDPSVPQRFASAIAAITGLDNLSHAVPLHRP